MSALFQGCFMSLGGLCFVKQAVHDESAGKAAEVRCGISRDHGLLHYEVKSFKHCDPRHVLNPRLLGNCVATTGKSTVIIHIVNLLESKITM